MRKIISFVLAVTMLLSALAIGASAATREEEFISDVALVYKDSVEEARAAIAGTDWKLFEYDLNPNADYMIDDGVFLIYKTSTNVEDAITDLRVMDMYGGFSISNYAKQLEKSREEYTKKVNDLRKAAAEFKALYEAGDEMARLAYRQMNYYKDIGETDMLMGDFFLDMPTDEKVVQVMMEGNVYAVVNLISLLAVGISGQGENTLSSKIEGLYAIKDTLTDIEYYDDGERLYSSLAEVRAKLLRYDALLEEYDLEDDEMSDEEFVFVSEYASLALIMEKIKLGDASLADVLRGGKYTVQDLYPIVAAFSAGQKALIAMGQLETVLKYNAPSKPIEELNSLLDEIEAGLKNEQGDIVPVDVYLGVDRSIFKGSFAMTSAAERQQALTGETWDMNDAVASSKAFHIAAIAPAAVSAVATVGLMVVGAKYIKARVSAAALKGSAYLAERLEGAALVNRFVEAWAPTAKMLSVVAVAALLVAGGIAGISTWYNYYNPDYTEIPNTMIDVRETDLGDRYIKYTAAKVFGVEEDKNADFNAYQGKEWIALYYTKDASAGNCLIPKFVYKVNDATIARRHQGISMFGETEAFNLNSHVYNNDALGVYITIRYSTTEKAAADLPSVVGSLFATGAVYAITALGGAAIGVGGTLLLQKAKKKKEGEIGLSEESEGT